MAGLKLVKRKGSDVWYARGTLRPRPGFSKRIFQSLDLYDKEEAAISMAHLESKLLLELNRNAKADEKRVLYFKEALEIYRNRRVHENRRDENAFKIMEKHLGMYELDDLTFEVFSQYVDERHTDNAPSSIQRDFKRIKACLNYVSKQGYLPHIALLRNTARIDELIAEYDDARCRWLEPEERDLLLNHSALRPEVRDVLTVLFFQGFRLSEALRLTTKDVTVAGATVWNYKGKKRVKKYRTIPLHPRAESVLDKSGRIGRYFTMSESMIRRELKEACNALNIEDFRIHDCRHTFAVHLRLAGADIDEIAKMLGHSNVNMASRYSNIHPGRIKGIIQST